MQCNLIAIYHASLEVRWLSFATIGGRPKMPSGKPVIRQRFEPVRRLVGLSLADGAFETGISPKDASASELRTAKLCKTGGGKIG